MCLWCFSSLRQSVTLDASSQWCLLPRKWCAIVSIDRVALASRRPVLALGFDLLDDDLLMLAGALMDGCI